MANAPKPHSKTPKSRCWVCSYIDLMHPFTLYQRWFYSEGQARNWMSRQNGLIHKEIHHV